MVRLKLFSRGQCGFQASWCERLEKGIGDSLIYLYTADVEAIFTPAIDDILTRAMVTWCVVPAAIMDT
jgi:hypothetical protein